MNIALDAAAVVSNCLRTVEPSERQGTLCALLTHTAAAMVPIVGQEKAAMACYTLADHMVSTEPSER